MIVCACMYVCRRGAMGDPQSQWDGPGAHSAAVDFPRSHNDAGRATCKPPKWHNCQRSQVKKGEQRSPASGSFWFRGWPLNTPANFSTLVHVATGGPTGGISTLQKAAVGSPNCPAKGWREGVLDTCQKYGAIRLKWKIASLVKTRYASLQEHKFTYKHTTKNPFLWLDLSRMALPYQRELIRCLVSKVWVGGLIGPTIRHDTNNYTTSELTDFKTSNNSAWF